MEIQIRRIRTFLGFPDLDPVVIDPDPDPSLLDPDPDPLVRGPDPDPHQNVTDPQLSFCKMQRSESRNPDLDAIFFLLDPNPLEMESEFTTSVLGASAEPSAHLEV